MNKILSNPITYIDLFICITKSKHIDINICNSVTYATLWAPPVSPPREPPVKRRKGGQTRLRSYAENFGQTFPRRIASPFGSFFSN